MVRKRSAVNALVSAPLICAMGVIRCLPIGAARRLAGAITRLLPLSEPRQLRRAIAVAQSGLGISVREARGVVWRSVRNLGYSVAEMIHLGRMSDDQIRSLTRITNPERLRDALAHGRGVIAVCLHVGNYELSAARLIIEGFPIAALSRERSSKVFQRMIDAVHLRTRLHVIPIGSPREIIQALHNNECVVLMCDQDTKEPDLFVRFLGRWASASALPARLARKYRCPVLSLASVRREHHIQELLVGPPIEVPVTDDEAQDVLVLSARIAERIDSLMREWGDQWLWWLYDRWRTQPERAPNAPLVEPDGTIIRSRKGAAAGADRPNTQAASQRDRQPLRQHNS